LEDLEMTKEFVDKNNFEQNKYIETEQKFLPLFPEKLDRFRLGAVAIEQVYLSHPSENFHLRLRRTESGGNTTYNATLKDAGTMTETGLKRLEVTGKISAERFDFYNQDVPVIRKWRAEPYPDISIDFFEDGHIHVESENPQSWRRFTVDQGLENDFIDATGDNTVDNEWRAHYTYESQHDGHVALLPNPDLNLDEVEADILRLRTQKHQLVSIGGRSGSGKSTLVKQMRQRLHKKGVTTALISTDDYNHGNTHLYKMSGGQWENYDASDTYDLSLCQSHLGQLASGLAVPRHRFDFISEEPVINGEIQPADVTFVEGVKAHHPAFREQADLYYEMPTPLATCIGRRIMRDLTERPRFSPEQNLAYYLEYTEPEYRKLRQNS
jgi:uridine kinase